MPVSSTASSLVDDFNNESKRRLLLFFDKDGGHPVAENAEAAEDLQSHPPERFWMQTDFLLWRIKGSNIPPLVSTGASTDPSPGALNSPNTKVLFGGSELDYSDRSGGQFKFGWWLDDERRWGLEGGYFFLGGRSVEQTFSSPGNPPLAVPFFNLNTGMPDSSLVAYPGIISGHINVEAPSFLQSAEANLVTTLLKTEHFQLEGLVGFRYAGLNEGLYLRESSLVGVADSLAPMLPGLAALDGRTLSVSDFFDTRNNFYGGQFGTRADFFYKRFTFSILAKVAIGMSNESVDIHGATSVNTQPATAYGAGLLAGTEYGGHFTHNAFAVVPEFGVNLGFQLTDHIRVAAGYNFLYWSNVVRPGDQIDTAINTAFVPMTGATGGPARPAFNFRSTDFFAYGVNFSLEVRY